MHKKRLITTCLLLLLLNGCMTVGKIHKQAEKVNYLDGISRHEAMYLARRDCYHDPACFSIAQISFPALYEDNKYPHEWIVKFGTSWARNYFRVVRIDKINGKITRGYYSWHEYFWVDGGWQDYGPAKKAAN